LTSAASTNSGTPESVEGGAILVPKMEGVEVDEPDREDANEKDVENVNDGVNEEGLN